MSRRLEDQFQSSLADYLRVMVKPGVVWYYTVNEGKRSPQAGARLKRLGMRPGVADLVFILPPGGRAAYLELKAGKQGRVTDAQRQFADDVTAAGAFYQIAHDMDEAIEILSAWGVLRGK